MSHWQLLIRHAHRDVSDRNLDNGLSEKGFRQCQELTERLQKLQLKPKRVFSSPKLRCLDTAEAVAEWAGVEVEVDERLIEQTHGEGDAAFMSRIEKWWKEAGEMHDVAFVSHGDFIPQLAKLLGHRGLDIHKGDFIWVQKGHIHRP